MGSKNVCKYIDKSTKSQIKSEVHLSIVIQNPIYRNVKIFFDRRNPNGAFFNKDIVGLDFDEYINSEFMVHDYITRSLTCKAHDILLNEIDLERAKYILEHQSFVSVFSQDDTIRKMASTSNCIKKRAELVNKEEIFGVIDKHFEDLVEANKFDIRLYSHVLSSILNDTAK